MERYLVMNRRGEVCFEGNIEDLKEWANDDPKDRITCSRTRFNSKFKVFSDRGKPVQLNLS